MNNRSHFKDIVCPHRHEQQQHEDQETKGVDKIGFCCSQLPEDNSEHHTRRRENLKSHKIGYIQDKKSEKQC
jgi:hypothetical protein